MKKSHIKSVIKEMILNEWEEDLKKQCVLMMGLPASGKSTFINNGSLSKYIPGSSGYKVANSDVQLKAAQYVVAQAHYEYLTKNVDSIPAMEKFVRMTTYNNPWTKKASKIPINLNWWNNHKDEGFDVYFKAFFKAYYATYMDVRDLAKGREEELFKTKIKTSGNLIIIDTTGTNFKKTEERFEEAHRNGFTTTVIYLEIDPEYAIARDEFRKKEMGRGVGESVIMGYVGMMDTALAEYKKEGAKPDGYVDRLIHLKWQGDANPKNGKYNLLYDKKYYVDRKSSRTRTPTSESIIAENPDRLVDVPVHGTDRVEKFIWYQPGAIAFASNGKNNCFVSDVVASDKFENINMHPNLKGAGNRGSMAYTTHGGISSFYKSFRLAPNEGYGSPPEGRSGECVGRIWVTKKIISFWVYPKKTELESWLKKLQDEVYRIHGIKVNFKYGWLIEIENPETRKSLLVNLAQVLKHRPFGKKVEKEFEWLKLGKIVAAKDIEIAHMLAPIIKQQKKMAGAKLDPKARDNMIKYYVKKDRMTGDLDRDEKAFYHMLRVMR